MFDSRVSAIYILVAVTAAKLVLAGLVGSTADVANMLSAARAFLAGQDLLEPANTGSTSQYFLLGHFSLAAAALLISRATGLSFDFAIKVPAILSDLLVAMLLRAMPGSGDRAAILYIMNPVTFLLSVYHGQLHTVALAGAVLALWFADRQRFLIAGLFLAVATTVRQHFAALIVPLAIGSERRQNAALGVFTFSLLILNTPFLGNAHPERLLAPESNYGLWGYAMLLHHGPRLLTLVGLGAVGPALAPLNRVLEAYGIGLYWLWAGAFVVWVWRRRVADRWRAALLFLLGIYTVGTGFGVQRLIWAVPFWLVVNTREATVYSALAGAYLVGSYWQWSLNTKYHVASIVANLHLLARGHLIGVILVGGLGFLTWVYCARAAWRLART